MRVLFQYPAPRQSGNSHALPVLPPLSRLANRSCGLSQWPMTSLKIKNLCLILLFIPTLNRKVWLRSHSVNVQGTEAAIVNYSLAKGAGEHRRRDRVKEKQTWDGWGEGQECRGEAGILRSAISCTWQRYAPLFLPSPGAGSRGSRHMGKRGQDVSGNNRLKTGRPQCAGSGCCWQCPAPHTRPHGQL